MFQNLIKPARLMGLLLLAGAAPAAVTHNGNCVNLEIYATQTGDSPYIEVKTNQIYLESALVCGLAGLQSVSVNDNSPGNGFVEISFREDQRLANVNGAIPLTIIGGVGTTVLGYLPPTDGNGGQILFSGAGGDDYVAILPNVGSPTFTLQSNGWITVAGLGGPKIFASVEVLEWDDNEQEKTYSFVDNSGGSQTLGVVAEHNIDKVTLQLGVMNIRVVDLTGGLIVASGGGQAGDLLTLSASGSLGLSNTAVSMSGPDLSFSGFPNVQVTLGSSSDLVTAEAGTTQAYFVDGGLPALSPPDPGDQITTNGASDLTYINFETVNGVLIPVELSGFEID